MNVFIRLWPYRSLVRLGFFLTFGFGAALSLQGQTTPATGAVAVGTTHAIALRSDGTVWTWGANANGQLGDGTTVAKAVPAQVSGLSGVAAVTAGNFTSYVLKIDGTVWAAGYNSSGQVGDGTTINRTSFVQVSGLSGVTKLSGGGLHALAIKSDGTGWAWGLNSGGRLGDGTVVNRSTPVQIVGLTDLVDLVGGMHFSLALKADGTVWSWGSNSYGQLGDGTTTDRATPAMIGTLSGITAIAAGTSHALALKSDGTVWSWGFNSSGELGDGSLVNRSSPVQVSLSGVQAIAAGPAFSLARKSDGSVWSWGVNSKGQLGNGGLVNQNVPGQVIGLTAPVGLDGGGSSAIALRSDGALVAWGDNASGQLGNGSTAGPVTSPLAVTGLVLTGTNGFISGGASGLALLAGGVDQNVSILPSGTGVTLLGGKVGINTATPLTRLMVAEDLSGGVTIGTGTVADGGNLRLLSSTNHWNVDNLAGTLRFFTETGVNVSAVEIMKLTDAGQLQVRGLDNQLLLSSTALGGTSAILFQSAADAGANARIAAVSDNSYGAHLAFFTDGDGISNSNPVERMRVTSSGKVGIGTTSPTEILDVAGNAQVQGNATITGSLSAASLSIAGTPFNPASYVQQSGGTLSGALSATALSAGTLTTTSGSLVGGATGLTLSAGGTNQNVTLTPSGSGSTLLNGNVGIGVAAPTAKLSVKGTGSTTGLNFQAVNASDTLLFAISDAGNVGIGGTPIALGTSRVLSLMDPVAHGQPRFVIVNGTTGQTAGDGFHLGLNNDESVFLRNKENTDLSIWTNDLQRVTIQAGGNVGIGTATPSVPLDVLGATRIQGNATVTGTLDTATLKIAGTTFNPASYVQQSGGVVSGALTATTLSAATVTATGGSLIGGATGLTLSSGGTNQNITLTPAGTGYTLLNGKVGIGVAPTVPLDVAGAANVSGNLSVGSALTATTVTATNATVTGTLDTATLKIAGTTFNPASYVQQSGGVVSGTLTATSLSAGTLTVTGGTVTGGATGLTLSSGSSSQDIVLNGGSTRVNIPLASSNYFSVGNGVTDSFRTGFAEGDGYRLRISVNGSLDNTNYALASDLPSVNKSLYVNRPTGGAIHFKEGNATSQLFLAAGGNLGVGTTTPSVRLDVSGATNISGNATVGGLLSAASLQVAGQALTVTNLIQSTGTYADPSWLTSLSASKLTTGTLPASAMPAYTGDVTAAAGSTTLALANSGVTAGTYGKVTVDAKGRVTAGTSLASSDVTAALTYTPYNATNPANYIAASGAPVQSVFGRTGAVTLTSADVTTALTYTPANKAGDTFTGNVKFAAGTASLAPVTLQTGTNLSSPVFGAVEFDGTNVYVTNNASSPTRRTVAFAATTLAGYGITDPVVLTSGTYADPSWLTSLSASKLTTGTLPASAMPAYSGDVTAAAGSTTLALANSGVTAGTYGKVTVDAKGRVTAGTSIASSDVTAALAYTPYNATNPANYIAASGAPVQSVFGRTGAVTLTSADVTTALTYTPANKAGDTFTGNVKFAAGTASLAPVTLQTGTNLSSPVFGAVEFDGTNVYVTNNASSPTRRTVAFAATTLAGYGITDPVVLTSGTYADPSWLTSLSASKLTTGTLPASAMPAYTGDVTAAAGSTTLALANSGVTAGTYGKVTVDAKGRVTAGTSLASSDVTAALTYTPYNATNPANYIAASGAPVQSVFGRTGAVTLQSTDISSVLAATPAAVTGTAFTATGSGNIVNSTVDGASTAYKQTVRSATAAQSGQIVFYKTREGGANLDNGHTLGVMNFNGRVNGVETTLVSITATYPTGGGADANSRLVFTTKGANATKTMTFNESGNLSAPSVSTTNLTSSDATYLATTGGNVGIGTSTPTARLDVAGAANVSGNVTVGGGVSAASLQVGGQSIVPANLLQSTGTYVDPTWLPSLAATKLTGTLAAGVLPAYTGDVTSSGGSVALTLTNSGVTPGTYGQVTVDAKGRVTAGTALDSTAVTSALGFVPYNGATNPAGYVTAASFPVQSVFGRTGAVQLTSADVSAALGFTPVNKANDSAVGNVEHSPGAFARFGHGVETDGNDGKIGAGLFGSGLNIVGTQTTAAEGRIVRIWGTLIDNAGASYYSPSNLTNLSQLANGPGYITAASVPVQSVFGRTGAVELTSADIASALSAAPVALTASAITASPITGTASGLALNAGGTNQNITLTPSGTGATVLNGKVGIGTAAPVGALDVRSNNGSIFANQLYFWGAGLGPDDLPSARLIENWGMRFNSPDSRFVFASNTSILVGYNATGQDWGTGNLLVAGNVGIGTATPVTKLDVAGEITADYLWVDPQNSTGEGGQIELKGSGSYGAVNIDNFMGNARIFTLAPGKQLQVLGGTIYADGTGGPNYFAGNVGIGTNNPTAKLQVEGGDLLLRHGASGTSGRIIFQTSDNFDESKFIGLEGYWTVIGAHGNEGWKFKDNTGDIVMQVNGQGGNNGFVGIGTTEPAAKLHVAGDSLISGALSVWGDIASGAELSGASLAISGPATIGTTLAVGGQTTTQSLSVNTTATIAGNVSVGGSATIEGQTSSGSLSVTQSATIGGNVTIEGAATFKSDATTRGNSNVQGNLAVSGNATIIGGLLVGPSSGAATQILDLNGGFVRAFAENGGLELASGSDGQSFIDFRGRDNLGSDYRGRLVYIDGTGFEFKVGGSGSAAVSITDLGGLAVGGGISNSSAKLHVSGGSLGSTAGNTVDLARFHFSTGNNEYLNISGVRAADSTSWETGDMYIRRRVDVSDQGFIKFTGWDLAFGTGSSEAMRILANGNVGIGSVAPSHKLTVKGTIRAQEIIVDNVNIPDYVFAPDYKLRTLAEVEEHIKEHHHLPDIPSAATIAEQGLSVGEMQARLLAKIEELTLHMIEQEKRLSSQAERIQRLESENANLKTSL